MKLNDLLQKEADRYLEECYRIKCAMLALPQAVKDLEVGDYVNSILYREAKGYISLGSDAPKDVAVKLLDILDLDHVTKEETCSGNMRATFPITEGLDIRVVRTVKRKCHKVKVLRKVKPQVIEVCGEVDEDHYEILEYLDEEA